MAAETPRRAVPGRRSATLLLQTVGEFHKRGYQGLRIIPRADKKPWEWRCFLAVGRDMDPENGAHMDGLDIGNSLPYSSANGPNAGWAYLTRTTAAAVADDMVERFSGLLDYARYDDFQYAGWFLKLLGQAELGYFPSAGNGPGAGDKPVRLYAWPDPKVSRSRPAPLPAVPKPFVPDDRYR